MQPPPTSGRANSSVVILDLQLAHDDELPADEAIGEHQLPTESDICEWVSAVLNHHHIDQAEITVRTVGLAESQDLNLTYRGQDKPTNVLSFPFDSDIELPIRLLGDLVICVPVMQVEAKQQGKTTHHHWAHLVVHGTLHLLGYDHIEEDQAEQMESLEVEILSQFNIVDPYQKEST